MYIRHMVLYTLKCWLLHTPMCMAETPSLNQPLLIFLLLQLFSVDIWEGHIRKSPLMFHFCYHNSFLCITTHRHTCTHRHTQRGGERERERTVSITEQHPSLCLNKTEKLPPKPPPPHIILTAPEILQMGQDSLCRKSWTSNTCLLQPPPASSTTITTSSNLKPQIHSPLLPLSPGFQESEQASTGWKSKLYRNILLTPSWRDLFFCILARSQMIGNTWKC